MSPYSVGAIANFMIGRSLKNGPPITHLQLQKLVYIGYGFYFAQTNKKLFRERIEAWPYGPVVPELYHEFKRFEYFPIRNWSAYYDYSTGKFEIPLVSKDDFGSLKILDFVWTRYGRLPAKQLVKITHAEGTPWKITIDQEQLRIADDLICRHYNKILDDAWESPTSISASWLAAWKRWSPAGKAQFCRSARSLGYENQILSDHMV